LNLAGIFASLLHQNAVSCSNCSYWECIRQAPLKRAVEKRQDCIEIYERDTIFVTLTLDVRLSVSVSAAAADGLFAIISILLSALGMHCVRITGNPEIIPRVE
jgi:hypothetical protein